MQAPGNAFFGEGTDRILLDDVVCTGDEATLLECSHKEFGDANCAHSEDAGVICALPGKSHPSSNILSVLPLVSCRDIRTFISYLNNDVFLTIRF